MKTMRIETRRASLLVSTVLCAVAFCAACQARVPAKDAAAIRDAVERRVTAITEGDKALFMSLLAQDDPEYSLEQSRWFDYRMSTEIIDLSIEADSITPVAKDECDVALHQSYLIGPNRDKRDFRNVQRYKKVAGAWLDADLKFDTLESAHFTLRYQPGIDPKRVDLIASHAESAWNTVAKSYGAAPAEKTVIKIFSDQELLRQNSKITIARLFNGWGEPGESIKMRLRPSADYSYAATIAHELVHKLTLSASKNLCSWFAEGSANYFGSFASKGGNYLDGGFHKPSDYQRSIAWLGSVDPEAVVNDEDWWIYGGMAGTVVKFMEERYGSGSTQAIIKELGNYPQPESGWVYAKDDAACREYLAAAIPSVLGIDMEQFDNSWQQWIKAQ